jgi:hypothetical protein
MKTLRQALGFWKKTFVIALKRSRPTLKRLPFYVVAGLVAYFWRPEAHGQLLFALLAIFIVWAATMFAHLVAVPAELCTLSTKQRNLQAIALRLKDLYDKGNQLAALPGDVGDDIAAGHLMMVEQWRADTRAAVSEYSPSESLLFDTIATDHLRQALRYDRAKPKRDAHLAAVLQEMGKLRLIAARASQEAEEIEQRIHLNRVEQSSNEGR